MPRFITVRTIGALILREMASTYGRSPGGYIWAVLEPIGMIAVMSVAFGLLVRAPALGTNFLLFYATGYLPFALYGEIAAKVGQALRYSRPLLAYPRVTWIDALLARVVLNVLTGVTVFVIVMLVVSNLSDAHVVLDSNPVILGMFVSILTGTAFGAMNCVLGGLYEIWSSIWSIASRPLLLGSGIFFIMEDLPRSVQQILWWNPLMHASGLVRSGFYATYDAAYVSLAYSLGMPLLILFLSLFFLRISYREILEK